MPGRRGRHGRRTLRPPIHCDCSDSQRPATSERDEKGASFIAAPERSARTPPRASRPGAHRRVRSLTSRSSGIVGARTRSSPQYAEAQLYRPLTNVATRPPQPVAMWSSRPTMTRTARGAVRCAATPAWAPRSRADRPMPEAGRGRRRIVLQARRDAAGMPWREGRQGRAGPAFRSSASSGSMAATAPPHLCGRSTDSALLDRRGGDDQCGFAEAAPDRSAAGRRPGDVQQPRSESIQPLARRPHGYRMRPPAS
ncbi:UNVERIFIED_ORG: hypothetical protein CLV66_10240 [Actinomadura viridilutea]